jgi:hypothetical protein
MELISDVAGLRGIREVCERGPKARTATRSIRLLSNRIVYSSELDLPHRLVPCVSRMFNRHQPYVLASSLGCTCMTHNVGPSAKLQKLKLIIEQRGTEAMASLASETEWLADLWGTEFKAWDETWLSEDISDAALDIVAMGLSAAPSSNEVSSHLPATTAKLTRTHSVILDAKQQPARSTRPLTASQSLNVIPTLDSRPKKGIPGRGVSISRTKSLSTILPPEAQHRVMTALDTVTEVEK